MEQDNSESKQMGHFGFDVAELTKLSLEPGDVLAVTIKNDEVSQYSLSVLREQLTNVFPNNNVMVLGVGSNDEVKFTVVKQENKGYCNDCSCGKKEQASSNQGDPQ